MGQATNFSSHCGIEPHARIGRGDHVARRRFNRGVAALRDVAAGALDHAQGKARLGAEQVGRAVRRAAVADHDLIGLASLRRDRIEQRGQAARFVQDGDDQ